MRVGVTTSNDHQAGVCRLVEAAGLEPASLPCIQVTALPEEGLEAVRVAATRSDRIVVSSRRTIRYLWPHGAMPDTPVLAVGRQTARAVELAGGTVTLVGRSDLSGLLDAVVELLPSGLRVLILHPEGVPPNASRLAAAGLTVDTAAVYRVEPLAPSVEPEVDAALFGSRSTVEGWMRTRPLEGIMRAAIGRPTADLLERLGTPAQVIAEPPSFANLIARLGRELRRGLERSPS